MANLLQHPPHCLLYFHDPLFGYSNLCHLRGHDFRHLLDHFFAKPHGSLLFGFYLLEA
jgi:hypothetical protein